MADLRLVMAVREVFGCTDSSCVRMRKATNKMVRRENDEMRAEYDFSGGVRGKHCRAMQAGYTITVHKADGTAVVKDVIPKRNAVLLEPDVQAHFPDSDSVNKALRCLIPLLPKKRRAKARPR
jgi:hypothetical protein